MNSDCLTGEITNGIELFKIFLSENFMAIL